MKFLYEHTPDKQWAHTFICVSVYKGHVLGEIREWCRQHFGPIKGRYRFDPYKIDLAFAEDSDALLFRMQWVTEITKGLVDEKPR